MVCRSSQSLTTRNLGDKMPKRILEPSSGVTGTKLNTPSSKFIRTKPAEILKKEVGRN